MTVAVRAPSGARAAGRALAWHVPPHAAMLGAMALAMGADAVGRLVAALALGALALGLAPFARAHHEVHGVLLDIGAMTIVLAAMAMATPPGAGAHAHDASAIPLALLACAAWLVARVRLTRGRVAVATGSVCGVQLAAMLFF